MKKILLLLAVLCLTACATTVTKEQFEKADIGPQPDKSVYIAKIKSHLDGVLIDPHSLRLVCAKPITGWAKNINLPPQLGWVVYCEVNTKNMFGGYTGKKPHIYLFKGNRLLIAHTFGDLLRGYDYDYVVFK